MAGHKLALSFGSLLEIEHADIGLERLGNDPVVDRNHLNVLVRVLAQDVDELLVVLHVGQQHELQTINPFRLLSPFPEDVRQKHANLVEALV